MSQNRNQISRVTRSKESAKTSYDRMSQWYDLIAGSSEWKFVEVGLGILEAANGEKILDIGHGTGKSILALAQSVGKSGYVYGLDISEGMHSIASDRVEKAGLSNNVDLRVGDAAKLPFEDGFFDAVFSSFTLELFDTPEIPLVLEECRRVLSSEGRLVIVSMAKKSRQSIAVKMYEWAHEVMPNYADCRPIYVTESLAEAGFQVIEQKEMQMWGLPVDAVFAKK
ncbi:MAG: class I SAM-dependent methyltransferase [Anaerolineales bacterium]|nr:class I SAM-dependent methyltransferase [Chloroflexota bacterium]MBL6981631.1 class I SAM-dependent methyltransferase [Anaerolineales bacterium]